VHFVSIDTYNTHKHGGDLNTKHKIVVYRRMLTPEDDLTYEVPVLFPFTPFPVGIFVPFSFNTAALGESFNRSDKAELELVLVPFETLRLLSIKLDTDFVVIEGLLFNVLPLLRVFSFCHRPNLLH